MNLKTVGYFKEMPHGRDTDESIFDFIGKGNSADIKNICHYLDTGVVFIVTPGVVEDIIEPSKGTAGIPNSYTDGTWLWPGDLPYYVKNYNLKLPDEFINAMRQSNWEVSTTIDDLDCENIKIDGINPFN